MKNIHITIFCCCTTLIGCRKSARNQRERYRSTEIVTESNRENSPIKEVRERRASSSQKKGIANVLIKSWKVLKFSIDTVMLYL